MREAFRSVGETLSEVGASWAYVVEITSYHVGLQGQKDALLRVHHEFIREPPYPAWTAAGVTELFGFARTTSEGFSCISIRSGASTSSSPPVSIPNGPKSTG